MTGDAELLRRFAETKAEDAFTELTKRHLGLVYHSALRRVNQNATLAEEIAQAVFLSLAREASSLSTKTQNGQALAGWLYVATRHAAANTMRAETRRARRELKAFAMQVIDQDGNDGGQTWAELRPELEKVMDKLSGVERDAVLLRYFENRPFAEVGAALKISEDAARIRVNRALEKMRQLLARRRITSTAAALGGLIAAQAVHAAPAGLVASVTGSAFSAAVPATAITSSIWIFMTKTKVMLTVASVMTLAVVGTAFYQAQSERTFPVQSSAPSEEKVRPRIVTDVAPAVDLSVGKRIDANEAPPATAAGSPAITVKAPAGWFKNGAKPDSYAVGVDTTESWGGMPSAYVESLTTQVEGGFGGMMQTISAERYAGKRVRLSGWVKTKDANEGGGHLWLRVDGDERGKVLAFDNMHNRSVKGTADWQEASIVLDVPAEASALAYGFFVKGGGKMWVNGQVIEEVGLDVPTTNKPIQLPPKKPLPKTPANLGFDPTK